MISGRLNTACGSVKTRMIYENQTDFGTNKIVECNKIAIEKGMKTKLNV